MSRPARPDVVDRLRPFVDGARLVLLLDPTGVPATAIGRLRKTLRKLGDDVCVVHLRNSTAGALFVDIELWRTLAAEIRGPTLLVVSRSGSFDSATALYTEIIDSVQDPPEISARRVPRVRSVWLDGERIDDAQFQRLTRPPLVLPGATAVPASALPSLRACDRALVQPAEVLLNLRKALRRHLDIGDEIAVGAEAPGIVRLEAVGDQRIAVIKALRRHSGWSLAETAAAIETLPTRIPVLGGSTADELARALRNVGATVCQRASPTLGSGWIPADVDTTGVFAATPALRLTDGWTLHGRAYVSSSGGNGVVCAVRAGARAPATNAGFPLSPSLPEGGRRVEPLLLGDGSLSSYLQASILRREMEEFAAWWHGKNWSTHRVVDAMPDEPWDWVKFSDTDDGGETATTTLGPGHDLRPRVEPGDHDDVIVTFFTASDLETTQLVCHRDRYREGRYDPIEVLEICCATAGHGYVF